MGQPVVWLTKEQSNIITPEDAAHFDRLGAPHGEVGEPAYGGPVQCVVNVERSRHVMRWTEFLRTTKLVATDPDDPGAGFTGHDILRDVERCMRPGSMLAWWISLKAIPLSRIIVPLTRAQAIEACEWQIVKHHSASAHFKQQRDSFAKLEPNALLLFHDGECKVAAMKEAA